HTPSTLAPFQFLPSSLSPRPPPSPRSPYTTLFRSRNSALVFGGDIDTAGHFDDARALAERLNAPAWAAPSLFRLPFPNKHPLFADRKSTRLNSSHVSISYAVFCLQEKKLTIHESVV